MEQSWRIRPIERKEVRGDDPIQYFLSHGGQKYLLSLRGVSERGKMESVLLSVGEERIGAA